LDNQDLKSIINTACKYNDIEVLEKIASSKIIKTAGVRDLLQGLGLQMSQTANESQFKDKSALSNFIATSSTAGDREGAKEIYDWWVQKVKEIGTASVNLNIAVFNSTTNYERDITFSARGCVELSDLIQVWNMLPANDIHKLYGYDPTSISGSGIYVDREIPPSVFDHTVVDQNGNEIWPAPSSPPPAGIGASRPASRLTSPTLDPVPMGTTFVNVIKGGGGNLGYLDELRIQLKSNPPKLSDNIHVKMFDILNSSMNDKAMSSMIRKNALAETPRAGLISNWKYIVSLPKEIENRMAKTPKTIMDYKQKLALKKYGRDLSQILNHRIKFDEFVFNPSAPAPGPTRSVGLESEIPFYKINELANNYFVEPIVQTQVLPLMRRTGELLNKIIPELDKDSSLTRNIIKTVFTPSDYLNSRGKNFH
jgi:hypothetical protein